MVLALPNLSTLNIAAPKRSRSAGDGRDKEALFEDVVYRLLDEAGSRYDAATICEIVRKYTAATNDTATNKSIYMYGCDLLRVNMNSLMKYYIDPVDLPQFSYHKAFEYACNVATLRYDDERLAYILKDKNHWAYNTIAFALINSSDMFTTLKMIPEDYPHYRKIVLAAATQNGSALKVASGDLQNDEEVVLAAVKQDGWALEWASDELKGNREVVVAAMRQNIQALEYASEEFREDRDFMLAAVKENGQALQWASEELQADREVVLAAVKQNGDAWHYASDELQHDHEVLRAAVVYVARRRGLIGEDEE